MDDIVRLAMAKWPNVPAVYGWLALDRRGNWLIRGERIGNELLSEFISRNYDRDEAGRWFFQNGPQRVFVKLAYAPWVLRSGIDASLATHTGLQVKEITGIWLDEDGVLVMDTEHGAAMVDDRDVESVCDRFVNDHGSSLDEDALLDAIERTALGDETHLCFSYSGRIMPVGALSSTDAPQRLGFVRDPQPANETATP